MAVSGSNAGTPATTRPGKPSAKYPAKYSALSLIKHGLTKGDWPRAWRQHDLKKHYDVVIIGAGIHGLATAYYLATNHGITNVAIVDKNYVGSGGSGRNTSIVRSNYLTPEGVRFYDRSVKLYEDLSADLNFNIMFGQMGHLTLAHNDSSLRTMRWRAEVNKLEGIDSEVIGPDDIKQIVPYMDTSDQTRYPILGALFHPPGGTVRHDAVNWGYARGADFRGAEIHQQTEVLGITTSGEWDRSRHRRRHLQGPYLHRHRGQLHRWLGEPDQCHGRFEDAARDPSVAGRRHRAGEEVPQRRGRVGLAARLCQPDRPR